MYTSDISDGLEGVATHTLRTTVLCSHFKASTLLL